MNNPEAIKTNMCPICGSKGSDSTGLAPGEKFRLIQIPQNRKCLFCGTIWRPACTAAGANAVMFIAVVAVCLLIVSAWSIGDTMINSNDLMFGSIFKTYGLLVICGLFWLGCSIAIFVFGIRVKQGKCGHMEVLRRGVVKEKGEDGRAEGAEPIPPKTNAK